MPVNIFSRPTKKIIMIHEPINKPEPPTPTVKRWHTSWRGDVTASCGTARVFLTSVRQRFRFDFFVSIPNGRTTFSIWKLGRPSRPRRREDARFLEPCARGSRERDIGQPRAGPKLYAFCIVPPRAPIAMNFHIWDNRWVLSDLDAISPTIYTRWITRMTPSNDSFLVYILFHSRNIHRGTVPCVFIANELEKLVCCR